MAFSNPVALESRHSKCDTIVKSTSVSSEDGNYHELALAETNMQESVPVPDGLYSKVNKPTVKVRTMIANNS